RVVIPALLRKSTSLMSNSIEGRSAAMCGDASSQNLVAPTASMYPERLARVARRSSGSAWQVTVTGLTCAPFASDSCGNVRPWSRNLAADSGEFYIRLADETPGPRRGVRPG